jgi:hypothetical protein
MLEVEGKAVRVKERLCFSGALISVHIESQDRRIPLSPRKGGGGRSSAGVWRKNVGYVMKRLEGMNEWNHQGRQKKGGWKGEKDETGSSARGGEARYAL